MIGKSAINRCPPTPLEMEDPQLDQWFISYFLIAKCFFSESRAPPKLDGWLSFCLLKLQVYRLYPMYQIIVGQYPITSSSLLAISLFSISFQYKTILHQHQLCYSTIKCNWLHWTNLRSPWNIPHLTWLQKYLHTILHISMGAARWCTASYVRYLHPINWYVYHQHPYPLVMQKTMEHHHFSWLNPLFRLGHFFLGHRAPRFFALPRCGDPWTRGSLCRQRRRAVQRRLRGAQRWVGQDLESERPGTQNEMLVVGKTYGLPGFSSINIYIYI